jgi:putative ABC transport system ATP-binding protein
MCTTVTVLSSMRQVERTPTVALQAAARMVASGDCSRNKGMDRNSSFIVLQQVGKVYRMGDVEVTALGDLSLMIQEGEFVAVMGASGSGKSTLMNILGCLDRPTSGRYVLAGRDVSRLNRSELAEIRNRLLGFVFQSFNLLARTSAVENVGLPLQYAGVALHERRQRAEEALHQVGLGDRLRHHPSQMSGGQQQRVAIARALVTRPKLILADEPTGNLDSHTSMEIMALLQKLWRSGMTIVMVTHELDIAEYASRIVIVRDGRILSDTRREARVAPVEAKAEPAAPEIAL